MKNLITVIVSARRMEKQKNNVCGADIHNKFIVWMLFSRDKTKFSGRFGMTLDEILKVKEWIIENNCEQVVVESTGVYWIFRSSIRGKK